MSVSPEEFKRRTKALIESAQELREGVLMLPVLRKPIIQFTRQLRQRQPLSPEQIQAIQQGLPDEQNPPTVRPQISFPFQRPRLLQRMPIRDAFGNLINALTVKSTGVRQKQQEDEEKLAYEERQKDLEASEMSKARLRRKGIYKEHGIEM